MAVGNLDARLVRRAGGRNQTDLIQLQPFATGFRRDQVTVMHRVKGPAKDSYSHHFRREKVSVRLFLRH
jgi:hypothetical protein